MGGFTSNIHSPWSRQFNFPYEMTVKLEASFNGQ
jgi:hypothetical protein